MLGRGKSDEREAAPRPRGRFERFVRKLWWLHSMWALAFGIGVMVYARRGLAHADKLMLFLGASWVLVFLALRFIVGPGNVSPDDRLHKKGLRLATNYVIKNLYQQMFFFLVPFYFASATWSLQSTNWWLAPLLLVCAVLSTMDLVMDNFVMQRRTVAALLYGVCLFGVLNLILPIAFGMRHSDVLLVSAAATAPAVALLTFSVRSVVSARGLVLTGAATALLTLGGWYGHEFVPPTPLAMAKAAVSYGTEGSREIVGEQHDTIPLGPAGELDGLRCATVLTQPGGLHDDIEHVWRRAGRDWIVIDVAPQPLPDDRGYLFKSYLRKLPDDPAGRWECVARTAEGQLVGRVTFTIR